MEYLVSDSLLSNWTDIFRTLLTGAATYGTLVLLLRISGKRALSKWNSFDSIVTIALGSVLASALLLKDVSFMQAILGASGLIGAQFLITWLSIRANFTQKWIKAQPRLLLFKGQLQEEALKFERVVENEVYAAVRSQGFASLCDIDAVVLEADGSFSVIENLDPSDALAMRDVKGFKQQALAYEDTQVYSSNNLPPQ
ncbi:MAG: YetF domain-containing protein [Cyanobacteria bacterium P01_C01_bin.89]